MGILQFFLLFLLAPAPSSAGVNLYPLSLYGARAVWTDSEHVNYQPNRNLNAAEARAEALDVETGERFPFALEAATTAYWTLSFRGQDLARWIRRPLVLVVKDAQGTELDRTYFQLGAMIDGLYHYTGCLGPCWENGRPVLRVWAPTAKSVGFVLGGEEKVRPMAMKDQGVWEIVGESSWKNKTYLFEVEVFTPSTGRTEKARVTDPYSLGLTENSQESVLVDMNEWKPNGWDTLPRPPLAKRTDAVLYELHPREFSRWDATVPENLRGMYGAFALNQSNGGKHLKELGEAGITHIHLLPVADFASVEEAPAERKEPAIPDNLPSDSPLPQEEIGRVRALDSFNWGYDPYHYFAPEGSYAVKTYGGERVKEFRELVAGLHRKGLRVVIDIVFNHTFSSGLAKESVLDKLVPNYYYRLDSFGQVRNTSCCSDTASERWMMEKLMRDSVESWRFHYKIDGFRFDLMNLHGVSTMEHLRDDIREKDSSILLYGEAWPFGSLLERDPREAYTMANSFGRNIGVFNDRLRDAARGGTTDHKEKSDQGFLTGLFYDFNQEPANRNTPMDANGQRDKLLLLTDVVRVGLAGNLREYRFRDRHGDWTKGGELFFRGSPVGTAANPEDTITYISAHDGYSLFDALQAKLPYRTAGRNPVTASPRERLERQILGAGLVAVAQGMPFFDSGIEILRSKSGDQNSYDSGDWFNRLDWSLNTNGWGVGLPPFSSNPTDWPFWRPRLADPEMNVGPNEIRAMKEAFLGLLRVRKNSPLFRLSSGDEVNARVRFLETEAGPTQVPGLIVMEVQDEAAGPNLDPKYSRMLVAVNVTNEVIRFPHASLQGASLERLYGKGEVASGEGAAAMSLPARTITVWGQR